jgi:hypothetical protein
MDAPETRNEIINRLMNNVILGNAAATHSVYTARFMQQKEIVDWLLLNQDVVHNTIMRPGLINTFIRDISDEMTQSARRMVAMNALKQHLLERQRQQQPQPPQSRVVGGDFHRRTTKFKHQKKSRKTKCRRH